jgi:hypothetical protein
MMKLLLSVSDLRSASHIRYTYIMSKGIGHLQKKILDLMKQKARWGWNTDTRDILNHLFPLPANPKRLRYGLYHSYGYGLGPVDDAGIIKDHKDIKHQEYDFSESQKSQVRRAIQSLARRGLIVEVSSGTRLLHLKEWIPNPPPPEYKETRAKRDAVWSEAIERIKATLR